ncbi:hypothetical protein [Thalassovita taeanensis]|uniref:Uncharacterized protein n=1 Tax=Thalassovita taeanensis TaxID=657014 RepID=A0A1H9HHU6_9RHOB|nr:hypothetical protein [Thalassovita taeanensis]SEQ61858.1 hypothetical protein SAMN04488092_109127 [Thalassovita taeanensis]
MHIVTGNEPIRAAGFVEVLTAPEGDLDIGYRIAGGDSGPTLLIVGAEETVDVVFDFFASLPGLRRLCGQLYFVKLDMLDHLTRPGQVLFPQVSRFDDSLFLPFCPASTTPEQIARQGCWSALKFCVQQRMFTDDAPMGRLH